MEYIIGYEECKNEENPNEVEITISEEDINISEDVSNGIHVYGETVSLTAQALNMLDFIGDIFVQYKQGRLPKSSKEERDELLRKWFDGSIRDVESQLYEQPVTPIESDSEQRVRNNVKRQRVDGDI